MLKTIDIQYNNEKAYDIAFTNGFNEILSYLKELDCSNKKICIVTDTNVAPLYAKELKETLEKGCDKCFVVSFEAGEQSKNQDTINKIYEVLVAKKFDRNDILVALGGGVVGDMTGFVAATYMRGIDFIQVPTTLLAMVDSSIGGKTGIDFKNYKNMIGAFKMPKLVYINLDTLKSLPKREFSAGMAEVIKYGMIMSKDFYYYLADNADKINNLKDKYIFNMIYMCCKFKQAVVERDPLEKGVRKILNFGHTAGHSIEKLKDFTLLHGECVAIGMVIAAQYSYELGMIQSSDVMHLMDTLRKFSLPVNIEGLSTKDIIVPIVNDKKMSSNTIHFVAIDQIGHAKITPIDFKDESASSKTNQLISAINFVTK